LCPTALLHVSLDPGSFGKVQENEGMWEKAVGEEHPSGNLQSAGSTRAPSESIQVKVRRNDPPGQRGSEIPIFKIQIALQF
jgi:hypothetical protein